MKKAIGFVILGIAVSVGACSKQDSLEIPSGSDVTVEKRDGVNLRGKLVGVESGQVVLESASGVKMLVPRSDIASVRATTKAPETPAAEIKAEPKAEAAGTAVATSGTPAGDPPTVDPLEYREATIPAGTLLSLQLTSSVASDTSQVEDKVSATLRSALRVNEAVVLPAGTAVFGHVTSADRSNKVKGRASIAFRFDEIDLPGRGGRESIRTGTVTRVAPGTKKKDATKIGVGAGAGAVIGGIIGGKSGAAKGAVIGGGAGTATVLATRGDEVRLGPGAAVSVKLTAPVTVRVPLN